MKNTTDLKFDEPAVYLITVKGSLNDEVYTLLDNAKVNVDVKGTSVESRILIEVKDQAHLSGILTNLYLNRYVILKLESIISDPTVHQRDLSNDGKTNR